MSYITIEDADLEVPAVEFPKRNHRRSALSVALIATIVVVVCVVASKQTHPSDQGLSERAQVKSDDDGEASAPHIEWDYGARGPDKWATLSSTFQECSGSKQSPINIVTRRVSTNTDVVARCNPYDKDSKFDLKNNGHTVDVFCSDTTHKHSIQFDDSSFELLQFHFHHPSEHTVDGRHFDAEVHLVHKNEEDGEYVVLALLCNVGGNVNPIFDTVIQSRTKFPLVKSLQKVPVSVAPSLDILQSIGINAIGANVWAYEGSLTTPPCTEKVQWLVLQQEFQISQSQFDILKSAIHHENNRPIQSIGDDDREITGRRVASGAGGGDDF